MDRGAWQATGHGRAPAERLLWPGRASPSAPQLLAFSPGKEQAAGVLPGHRDFWRQWGVTLRRVVDRGWGLKPHTALPRVQGGGGAQRPLEAMGGGVFRRVGDHTAPPGRQGAGSSPEALSLDTHRQVWVSVLCLSRLGGCEQSHVAGQACQAG